MLFLKRANVAQDLTAKLQFITAPDASGDRTKTPSPGELLSPNLNKPPSPPPDKP